MESKVKKNEDVAIMQESSIPMMPVDISQGNLPDLAGAKEFPLDLMSNYWTPENKGESKRMFYDGVKNRVVLDQQTGEAIELPCAFFFEKTGNDVNTVSNGSKRLVGIFEHGQIPRGTPLQITYMGKKKNATNGFQSDMWSVKPLVLELK